ncbi:MAG TPA: Gfo/Idh/MocA family oxidoreductase [Bacteroidales bacterium]|mgnify:CR=1 FL=1|nr:Gfo/Idh/MocA family oxidoreductase [Bacteroidales bacterium]
MIKIGIIGYGDWVKNAYMPGLKHDGRAEIVSISARSKATQDLIRENFGDTVKVYSDYNDLLKSNADAIMIAVPDNMHSTIITTALKSGKAVFYEPPIAHTRELISETIKKLVAAPQITHADLELALVPAVVKAAELIRNKVVGNVQSAGIRLQSNWGPEPDQDINNISRMSVWYTHVLNVLLGSTPKRVLVLDGYGTRGRRQSQSTGYYDYNGIWGELKLNIDSAEPLKITIDVVGSEGDILVDVLNGELRSRTKRNPEWKIEFYPAIQPFASWPGVNECITAFLDAVESKKPSFSNANVVANLHLTGLAADESKDTGTWAIVKDLSDLIND